jgi:hypothetical protein
VLVVALALRRSRITRHPVSAEETERKYGTAERREWMTRQPCVICNRRPSVSAHLRTGGTGRKGDATETVPMCTDHHDEYDGRKVAGGRLTFLAKYRLTMEQLLTLARRTEERWQAYAAVERAWPASRSDGEGAAETITEDI